MGIFFVHIVKTSIVLALMYMCFSLLLGKETFHRVNRVALMAMVILAFIFPFMQAYTSTLLEPETYMVSVEELEMLFATITTEKPMEQEITVSNGHILAISMVVIYAIGAILTAIYYIIGVARVVFFIKNTDKTRLENGNILCTHNKNISPFSYMKYIVVSNKDIEENRKEIITHEAAHIELKHSLDLIFIELCCIVLWFNPAIWLLKRDLKNIHEYEADESVIKSGANAKEYQLLLIKKAVGEKIYTAVNNFNHCLTKKRITMMLKQKSNKWAIAKYLFVIPLMAASTIALARPEIKSTMNELENVNIEQIVKAENKAKAITQFADTISNKTEKMPEFPGGSKELMSYINNKAAVLSREIGMKEGGQVITQFVVTKEGKIKDVVIVRVSNKKTPEQFFGKDNIDKFIKIFTGMPKWIPGTDKEGNAANVKMMIPVSFAFYEEVTSKATTTKAENKIYIIDDEEVNESEAMSKDSKDIESITVLKNKEMIAKYGDKAKDGVIIINTKRSSKDIKHLNGTTKSIAVTSSYENINGKVKEDTKIFIDGKEVDKSEMQQISAGKIKHIIVKRGKKEEGSGVVVIEMNKDGKEISTLSSSLYIVDGKKAAKEDIAKIKSEDIESMSVLKGKQATDKYGVEAKNGVIIINLKKK